MLTAEIKPHRGAPTLFVNGAPHSGAMYTTLRLEPQFLNEFVAAGVRLFAIDTTCAQHYYRFCAQVWLGPEQFDFSDLDRRIELILGACPQAHLVLRVYVGSPAWWDELYPDERLLDADGTPVRETLNFSFLGGIDPGLGPVKETVASFSSKLWRRDALRALATYVRHVEARYGESVIGYLLESGGTEEWYYWNVFSGGSADHSSPQRERFAEVAARENVPPEIPPLSARRATTTGGFFRDPNSERAAIAYGKFHNDIVADMLLDCARTVKAETGGRKLCGAFYGYAFDLCRAPHVWPESGHLSLSTVLQAPEIDFLVGPSSYLDRRPGAGVALLGGPAASVALHGKLWWNENDQYTHLTPNTGSTFYVRAENETESIQMHRREIAASICQGVPQWWFDMHGGWFSSPGLLAEIARERRLLESAVDRDRTPTAQVALVIDYRSPLYTESDNRLYQALIRDFVAQLAKTGAPFDVLLLDDLAAAREYAFYIFPNAFCLDTAQRETIRSTVNGRHALWLYGPGYLDADRTVGVAGISELTGFNIRLRERATKLSARTSGGDYGPGLELSPQFTADAAGGEVLAVYSDSGEPALLRRRGSIFAPVPGLPASLLRTLLRDAGVHLFTDGPDQVWACASFVAISLGSAGPRTLAMPADSNWTELFSGMKFAASSRGEFTIDGNFGDVLLFRRDS